jgi:hypothetical protein
MFLNRLNISFLAFLFFVSFSLFAQDEMMNQDEKNDEYVTSAMELTNTLQVQLNLNEEQAETIRETLYEYHEELLEEKHDLEAEIVEERRDNDMAEVERETAEFHANVDEMKEQVNEEIENVLEDNQRTQWASIKAQWWQQVDNKINDFKNNNDNHSRY